MPGDKDKVPPPENAAGGQTGPQTAAGGQGAPPPGATGTQKTGGTRPKDTKTAPPPQFNTPPPQVLQLTPELFQQTVAAAVTAALAATQQDRGVHAAVAEVAQTPVIPRREKKQAEFWTSRPTMWFRLFDGQFPATLSEDLRFNALLNHLPSAALPFVDHVLRAPGQDPFTRAKACLVKHYEVSPRDRARTLRSLTSLGDKTPSEMLHYMRSLLPGCPDNSLFEVIFIDLLPPNARDAAVKHELLDDMAEAADKVLAEAPSSSAVAAVADDEVFQVQRSSSTPSSGRKARDPTLCFVHARYGKSAWKCSSPKTCRMKDVISKPDTAPASENSKAGRR